MNVLITGAGGFIGSHLVERCVQEGLNVRAFVHYNSRNHWGWLEDSPMRGEIEVVAGDIREFRSVFSASEGMDVVFHLAALIGIPYSYEAPLSYIRTNLEGTYNVLESARQLRVQNVLVTSTSETYGTAQYVPIDETHPLVAQSPYAASKIGSDQLALSYHRSFSLPVKIVRPFNTYGPRQSARAVIPTVISQLLNGDGTIRLGNLRPTRDFTFVRDTVAGFLEIARSSELVGQVTNIGMNEEVAIGQLAQHISRVLNKEIHIDTEEQRERPHGSEVERLRCNNAKLLSNTAWRPAYTLESGLVETIEWFMKNQHKYKSYIYNL